ncbi:MAG: hypothetical protein ACYSUS_07440 [Planctomycetota bacterium]
MSRFEQAIYSKVLQEPRRRYLLKKKEKPLWKPKQFKQQLVIWLSILLFILGLVLLMAVLDRDSYSSVYFAVGYLIAVPFIVIFFLMDRWGSFQKNKTPMSLVDFNGGATNISGISRVYVRSVRHVLGHLYSLNPCQIYPTDTSEKLVYLTRTGRPPYAFELILGVAHRLSISLNDNDVDQITENIYNCPDVETLIVKLSRELEKRRGNNCQGAIDITHSLPEEKMKIWKCVLWGCLLAGVCSVEIFFNEHDFSVVSIVLRIVFLIIIGGLLGWGYAALGNWKPKKTSREDENILNMLSALGKYSEAGKYLYFFLSSLPVGESVTIRESEPLPEYEIEDLERMPLFSEICAYLKSAMDVEDRFYEQPIEGGFDFCVKDKESQEEKYHITAIICDGIEDAYVTFQRKDPDGKLGEGNC